MFVVQVQVLVKPDCVEQFKRATIENARNSMNEPGVARFDFLQQLDDPTRFLLMEAYRAPADADRHKETAHYRVWRDTVGEMMAQPRISMRYANVFPDDAAWG
jgi:quinol monooxygenase YgiN